MTLEREFGVPIPGHVLAPARWTKTALKRLPERGPLDWPAIFGRRAPLILDIGCGNGRFLLGSAFARPDLDHLGIDILPLVLRYATRRANQRGLTNVRFAACDGQRLLDQYAAPSTFSEIHCYHPQPYHESRLAYKRMLTPAFLALVHDRLEDGGCWYVQTDNAPYWAYIRSVAGALFDFQEHAGVWPDAPRGRTRREILARRRGLLVWRGWGVKRSGLSTAEIAGRIAALPPPTFDAGPPLADLDALERECP
jgi:tRNA (guanine-N7-)-methyltransferase